MNKKLKILITGPVPPPAGGISIHIQRLSHLLKDDFDISFVDESQEKKNGIYNMRSLKLFSYFNLIRHADILFIHSGNKLFKKIHLLTGRIFRKKILTTIHGYGPKRKAPLRSLDSFFFRMADKIILVNDDIANRLSLPAGRSIMKHAFLPPVMKDEPALPLQLSTWIANARTKNETVICANASRLDVHNRQDLYGLDMAIEAANRLVKKDFKVSFIFTVSSVENGSENFNNSLQLIKQLGIEKHFFLLNERLSFVKLIELSDIVLRPTNADGDALTVREALYFRKYVVASDVVKRPPGTVLFETRNMDDLETKLTGIIKKCEMKTENNGNRAIDSAEDLKSFYVNLLNNIASK